MLMKKDDAIVGSELLYVLRDFFRKEGVPELTFDKITQGTGACENTNTVFKLEMEKDKFALFLSQTDQLLLEDYIIKQGMKSGYTISKSFRKEPKVGDGRHLSEFSLCEFECRDMNLKQLIEFMKKQLSYICKKMANFDGLSKKLQERLKRYSEIDYPVITYDEVIQKLQNMGISVKWGDDLSSRDEEFVCGIWGKNEPVPVMVTHYPREIKFFNMLITRDKVQTVDCADFLLPFAGETWGSSEREIEYNIIHERLTSSLMYKHLIEMGGSKDAFDDYLSLFKDNNKLVRSGAGIGMGRILQFILARNEILPL